MECDERNHEVRAVEKGRRTVGEGGKSRLEKEGRAEEQRNKTDVASCTERVFEIVYWNKS